MDPIPGRKEANLSECQRINVIQNHEFQIPPAVHRPSLQPRTKGRQGRGLGVQWDEPFRREVRHVVTSPVSVVALPGSLSDPGSFRCALQ